MVAQDEVVVAEVVDVSVESANPELFCYALDEVPAPDRDAFAQAGLTRAS